MTLVGDTAFTLPKQENKNNKKKKTTAKQKQPKTPTPHSSPAVHSSSPFRAYMSFQNLTPHTSDLRSRGAEVPGKHCSAESAGNFVAFKYKEKSSKRPPREAPCSATHFKYGC
jgi:hypothetical protein